MKPSTYLVSLFNTLDQYETAEQMFDADKDYVSIESVLDVPLTITSARAVPSAYRDDTYAVIGFTKEGGTAGRFTIGGNASVLPLAWSRTGKLPLTRVLCTAATPKGRVFNWRKA
jgi:hypothetical protein